MKVLIYKDGSLGDRYPDEVTLIDGVPHTAGRCRYPGTFDGVKLATIKEEAHAALTTVEAACFDDDGHQTMPYPKRYLTAKGDDVTAEKPMDAEVKSLSLMPKDGASMAVWRAWAEGQEIDLTGHASDSKAELLAYIKGAAE